MIAITGSTGFIGHYIVDSLPSPQKRLVRKKPLVSNSYTPIIGDLNQTTSIESLVSDTNTLIHLAWVNNPWNSNQDIENDIQLNLVSSIRLFETFAKKNPKGHVIFASTGGNMYRENKPSSELDLPKPWSSYSINKLSAEQYLQSFCSCYGIRTTVLRISNPYGVILPSNRTNGLIGVIFAKLLQDEPLKIIDSLQSVRDYLHLEDLKSAFQAVIKTPPSEGEFRLFNVSSGIGHSLQDVMDLIESVTGKQIQKTFANSTCSPSTSILSPKYMEEKLQWKPHIHLREGLEMMWKNRQTLYL